MFLQVASAFLAGNGPARASFVGSPASAATGGSGAGTTGRRNPILRQVTYNDMEDLQRAREDFESLMKDQTLHHDVDQVPQAPILTSAGRHRRELEIELLESLRDSDDAIDELMHLWVFEHTAEEGMDLQAMEDSCSDGLVDEERALRRMIGNNPHWAEPRIRLATLYFFKGQTDHSYRAAMEALQIKPWHFEIYQLLIMLSLRQQDVGQALYWARSGLPHLRHHGEADSEDGGKKKKKKNGRPANRRRKAWVDRAVARAREQWQEAERATEAFLASGNSSSNYGDKRAVAGEGMWQ